jgi:hypothetical protein
VQNVPLERYYMIVIDSPIEMSIINRPVRRLVSSLRARAAPVDNVPGNVPSSIPIRLQISGARVAWIFWMTSFRTPRFHFFAALADP